MPVRGLFAKADQLFGDFDHCLLLEALCVLAGSAAP